jgi:hypothetical protein
MTKSRCIPITNLKRIKANRHKSRLFICVGKREGIIFPLKYGDGWWRKAEKDDIRRVMVY